MNESINIQKTLLTQKSQQTQDSSNVSLELGHGQPKIGPQSSSCNINTSIVDRVVQDNVEEVKKNIDSFCSVFLFQNIFRLCDVFIEYSDKESEKKQKELAESKFQEWFGISSEKYLKLMTSSETWNSLNEIEISAFLGAMERIHKTASCIVELETFKNDPSKKAAFQLLKNLESFLRSSDKVSKDIIENLHNIISMQEKLESLTQNLEELKKSCEECFSKPVENQNANRGTISARGKSTGLAGKHAHLKTHQEVAQTQTPKNETPTQKLKNALEFIVGGLAHCRANNHAQLLNKVEFVLFLDVKALHQEKQKLIEQAKECLLQAAEYHLKSNNDAHFALGIKLLKMIASKEVYKQTLENAYENYYDFKHHVYEIRDIAILNDLRETKIFSSRIRSIHIHCSAHQNASGDDSAMTQSLFQFLTKYDKEFGNLKKLKLHEFHVGDLTVPSLSKLQKIEIAGVHGNLTIEGSPELTLIWVRTAVNNIILHTQPKLQWLTINGACDLTIPTMPKLEKLIMQSPSGNLLIKSQDSLTKLELGHGNGINNFNLETFTIECPQHKDQVIDINSRFSEKVKIVKIEKLIENAVEKSESESEDSIIEKNEVQEKRSNGSYNYIIAGLLLLIAITIGVVAINPDLMRHYFSLVGLIGEQY